MMSKKRGNLCFKSIKPKTPNKSYSEHHQLNLILNFLIPGLETFVTTAAPRGRLFVTCDSLSTRQPKSCHKNKPHTHKKALKLSQGFCFSNFSPAGLFICHKSPKRLLNWQPACFFIQQLDAHPFFVRG